MISKEDKKERCVKLTEREIKIIIDELGNIPHNIFLFLNINKIISKLK